MKYTELETKVIAWSTDRMIIQRSTLVAQAKKLVEEAEEVLEAILDGDLEHAKMELGDNGVVAINMAEMLNTTTTACIELAYNKIKDRKGMMNKEGFYVKYDDLPDDLKAILDK